MLSDLFYSGKLDVRPSARSHWTHLSTAGSGRRLTVVRRRRRRVRKKNNRKGREEREGKFRNSISPDFPPPLFQNRRRRTEKGRTGEKKMFFGSGAIFLFCFIFVSPTFAVTLMGWGGEREKIGNTPFIFSLVFSETHVATNLKQLSILLPPASRRSPPSLACRSTWPWQKTDNVDLTKQLSFDIYFFLTSPSSDGR